MTMPGERQVRSWHDRGQTPHDTLRDALLTTLANQPMRAAWGEMALEGCRPDVYAVTIRRDRFIEPHIYEVKANRSDFAAELRSGKWRAYLPVCTRFDFVTLPGIASRSEIPPEAGWLEYQEGQFRRRKRAKQRQAEVPNYLLMRIALYRAPQMPVGRAWTEQQWFHHIEMKARLGRTVALILRDQNKARADLLRLQAEVAEMEARLLRLKAAEEYPAYATSDLFEAPGFGNGAND